MAVSRGGGEYSQEFSKEPPPCRHASALLLTVAKFLERIADYPFPVRLGSKEPDQGDQEPTSERLQPAFDPRRHRREGSMHLFSARAPSGRNSKHTATPVADLRRFADPGPDEPLCSSRSSVVKPR
jgi:hypothetical protein